MKLHDTSGAVVELPWDAVAFLLNSYFDRPGVWNGSRPTEGNRQWTVNKDARGINLILEADIHRISHYNEVVGKAQSTLAQGMRQKKATEAEIEMASQVNNADAVADLKAVLDGVEQAITEAEDTIANTKCPSPERTVYEFPATVSELKAYQGEPTKPKPSAKG